MTTTSAITTNGTAVPGNLAMLTVGSDTTSAATVVTFTNTYAAAKSSGGGSAAGNTGGAQLAASGFTGSDQDLAAAGVLFVLIGSVLVLATRPRGRHARR